MHIGLLTSGLSHSNGWAHYSLSLIGALQRQGIHTTIIAARNDDGQHGLDVLPRLPTVSPPDRFTLGRMAALALHPRIRHHLQACDLIHATAEPYAPLAIALAKQRPAFITVHGSYAHLPRVRRWPVNQIYRHAYGRAQLVCVSGYTQRVVQGIVPDAQTHVVVNGVDSTRFADLQRQPQRRPTVLTVGGVKRRKGTLELVQAIAKVRQTIADVQCIVVGTLTAEARYVQQVRAAIQQHDLTQHVQLLGFVDEATLRAWYAQAHLFAMPSVNDDWKFEGFGLVHLEAGSAGLPVIGTRGSGAEDAIADGVSGVLLDPAKLTQALPDAITRLLQNPDAAQRMGAAGRERAARYTWDAAASQLIALYQASPTA